MKSFYFTGEVNRYSQALQITDKRAADEYFTQLVKDNMKSAGPVRKYREAEAIERRNLAHYVANMDDEIKARVARLFKVARLPEGYIKDVPDPTLAPPRPGPHVSPIGKTAPGLTDKEIGVLTNGGFVVDDKRNRRERQRDMMKEHQQASSTVNPRRRDSWKPWQVETVLEASEDWRPKWIKV